MSECFIIQTATEEILSRVTSVCAVCYSEISLGDTIHYDTDEYRYICQSCQDQRSELEASKQECIKDEGYSLF